MKNHIKLVVVRLDHCRDRLAELARPDESAEHFNAAEVFGKHLHHVDPVNNAHATKPDTTWAETESIEKQLESARRATAIIASLDDFDSDDDGLKISEYEKLIRLATEATSSLTCVADALLANRSSHTCPNAVEAGSLMTQLARVLSQFQEQQALRAVNVSTIALGAGDFAMAATAAIAAEEAAAMAMWAACIGGLKLARDVRIGAAQRAAAEAVKIVLQQSETASAATTCKSSPFTPGKRYTGRDVPCISPAGKRQRLHDSARTMASDMLACAAQSPKGVRCKGSAVVCAAQVQQALFGIKPPTVTQQLHRTKGKEPISPSRASPTHSVANRGSGGESDVRSKPASTLAPTLVNEVDDRVADVVPTAYKAADATLVLEVTAGLSVADSEPTPITAAADKAAVVEEVLGGSSDSESAVVEAATTEAAVVEVVKKGFTVSEQILTTTTTATTTAAAADNEAVLPECSGDSDSTLLTAEVMIAVEVSEGSADSTEPTAVVESNIASEVPPTNSESALDKPTEIVETPIGGITSADDSVGMEKGQGAACETESGPTSVVAVPLIGAQELTAAGAVSVSAINSSSASDTSSANESVEPGTAGVEDCQAAGAAEIAALPSCQAACAADGTCADAPAVTPRDESLRPDSEPPPPSLSHTDSATEEECVPAFEDDARRTLAHLSRNPLLSGICWHYPSIRADLVTLLGCTVRRLKQAIGRLGTDSLAHRCQDLQLLNAFVKDVLLDGTAVIAEVLQLIARTDLTQTLSQLMAAAARQAAMGLYARYGSDYSMLDEVADRVVSPACGLLDILMRLSRIGQGTEELDPALLMLRVAMRRSQVLDHAARAVALIKSSRAQGESVSGGTTAGSHISEGIKCKSGRSESSGRRCKGEDGCTGSLRFPPGLALQIFATTLEDSFHWKRFGHGRDVWWEGLLTSPWVQNFLLLHVVSELSAADLGSDYGLPDVARLRSLTSINPATRLEGTTEGSTPSRGAGSLMIWAFDCWTQRNNRPCSDRALLMLSKRALDYATKFFSPLVTKNSAEGLKAAAENVEGGELQTSDQAVSATDLALNALQCAITITRQGRQGLGTRHFNGFWAPAVQTAYVLIRDMNPKASMIWRGRGPLQLLASMPLPTLDGLILTGPGLLPPHPGPDLAAALAAGYLPALECALRREALTVTSQSNGRLVIPVIKDITLLAGDPARLASLMFYADLRDMASLISSSAKAMLAVHYMLTALYLGKTQNDAFITKINDVRIDLMKKIRNPLSWDKAACFQQDRHWWWKRVGSSSSLRASTFQQSHSIANPAVGQSDVGSSSSGGGCGDGVNSGGGGSPGAADGRGNSGGAATAGEAAGASHSGSGGERDLSPEHQMFFLASLTLQRWLPVLLTFLAMWCSSLNPETFLPAATRAFIDWLIPCLHAYLDCRVGEAAATVALGRPSGARAEMSRNGFPSPAMSGGSCVGAVEAARAADSWEQVLGFPYTQEVLKTLVHFFLQYPAIASSERFAYLEDLAVTLLGIIIAFPRHGRALLRSKLGTGSQIPLLAGLQGHFADPKTPPPRAAVRHFLELAPLLAAGKEPCEADISRFRSADEGRAAAELAALLPPPCFVAAKLQMPLCSNPRCSNLAGDSEWGLQLIPCKGCFGEVSYCSRDCKAEHWRQGHKAECLVAAGRGRRRAGG